MDSEPVAVAVKESRFVSWSFTVTSILEMLRTLLAVVSLIRAGIVLGAPSILSENEAQHPLKTSHIPVPVTLGVMSRSALLISTISTSPAGLSAHIVSRFTSLALFKMPRRTSLRVRIR